MVTSSLKPHARRTGRDGICGQLAAMVPCGVRPSTPLEAGQLEQSNEGINTEPPIVS